MILLIVGIYLLKVYVLWGVVFDQSIKTGNKKTFFNWLYRSLTFMKSVSFEIIGIFLE